MARNYKREYKLYHGKPEQIKRRAARNKSRAEVKKAGGKVNGKDVHHKDGNPLNKSKKNLSVTSKGKNRAPKPKNFKGGRPKGGRKKIP